MTELSVELGEGRLPTDLVFHSNFPLSQSGKVVEFIDGEATIPDAKCGELAERLAREIDVVAGVSAITISRYELHVRIGQAFLPERNEICKSVVELIHEAFEEASK